MKKINEKIKAEGSDKSLKIFADTVGIQRRLTSNQVKTIDALRERAKGKKPDRTKMLEEYRKSLKAGQLSSKKIIDKKPLEFKETIEVRFNVKISKEAHEVLSGLKNKNIRSLIFPKHLKHGHRVTYQTKDGKCGSIGKIVDFTSVAKADGDKRHLGICLERGKKETLNLTLNYPQIEVTLRSPASMHQGDRTRRVGDTLKKMSAFESESPRGGNHEGYLDEIIDSMVLESGSGYEGLNFSRPAMENTAIHDFMAYEYVLDPSSFLQEEVPPPLPPESILDAADELEQQSISSSDLLMFYNWLWDQLCWFVSHSDSHYGHKWNSQEDIECVNVLIAPLANSPEDFADLAEIWFPLDFNSRLKFRDILNGLCPTGQWFEVQFQDKEFYFSRLTSPYDDTFYIHNLWYEYLIKIKAAFPMEESDEQPSEPVPGSSLPIYPFETYPIPSYNLGIRLVFRQEWRPLGEQRGEIARTIPLGPGQSKKVSTKIMRRTKVTHTAENLKSTESTTETSDTTKDSRDIVEEAQRSKKWTVNAEAGGGCNLGVFNAGGKIETGLEKKSSDMSKETSSQLSEVMKRTANKMRTESKVVVSTEHEESFETSIAEEIKNPNDEIAITYIYSMMQRQFEVYTSLAEVQKVAMFAESLPELNKIDDSWVKKNDWMLAKVLLDDSFRDVLASFGQDKDQESLSPALEKIGRHVDTVMGGAGYLQAISTSNQPISLDQVDLSQEVQRAYRETFRDEQERMRANSLMRQKKDRFLEHVKQNILHYYREIWSHEDPQQRIERYRKYKINVPCQWEFVTADATTVISVEDISDVEAFTLQGKFRAIAGSETVNFADLINPAGPIGYYGNYAIFYIRPEYVDTDIWKILDILKSPYTAYDETLDNYVLMDPYLQWLTNLHKGKMPANDQEKEEMCDWVPALREEYLKLGQDITKIEDSLCKRYYPEFLFRKDVSRRFVVDTNNHDIQLDPPYALEPFKRGHRKADLVKVVVEIKRMEAETLKLAQEIERMRLDNVRRQKLIDELHQYGDPDIERVVVVTGDNKQLEPLIATSEIVQESDSPINAPR